ncbi:GDP-L-fucose synthase [Massilibacteroides sp.]|uniref:GDP-L-fucose synthase family protein n=1 Tax=Massilibacteroides sp. TaxID=2034766 RepID=UPI002610394F|nr:GDP-L-fucose synthase [Massilibacteroides sp.]MDD4515617.1 GDP-L-fucose synthase [Massilibacteroides sp.]
MDLKNKIFVAGHRGLVGSAILKNLKERGFTNFALRTHKELDLTNQQAVNQFFSEEKPEYVFLSAAYVGGIMANNTYRGDFIYRNLMIQNNVIHAAYIHDVKKLLFLGSTCIYPGEAPQPMPESCLLTSPLEYTNEPYAIAKIAGIKMCESYNLQFGTNFIAVMPTNLYGPNDNFNLETSHVLPAIIRKMHLAHCLKSGNGEALKKDLNIRPIEGINGNSSEDEIRKILGKYGVNDSQVEIWGTGKPTREFLWSEEMADACVFVMQKVDFNDLKTSEKEVRNTHINIGTGKDISIKDVAELIKKTVGYTGELKFNSDKPDGTLRKLTDVTKLNKLGWQHSIEIEEGVKRLYKWYSDSTLSK